MTDTEKKLHCPPSSEDGSLAANRSKEFQIINVGMLALSLWRGKWFVVLFALIGVVLGIQKLTDFSPEYRAIIVVSPSGGISSSTTSNSGGIQGLARMSGLTQLLGKATAEATTFDRLRYAIGSVELVRQLVKKDDIIRRTYSDLWDAEKGVWTRPTGLRFEVEQKLKSLLNLRQWQHPTVDSFAEFLRIVIEFEETEDAPFFRISYRNADREKAGQFLQEIFSAADTFLREQDKLRINQKKAYVERQLKHATLQDHKMLLLNFLSQVEQRLMLLHRDTTYSVNIVEPVFTSSSPTSPNLLKDFGVVFVGWLLAGIGIVILFFLIKSDRDNA